MWPNLQETAELVIFTEEIFNKNLFFVQCDKVIVYAETKDFGNQRP